MSNKSVKSKPTSVYASISMAIVMFLLGLFILILLHSRNLTNIVKERMNIIAELNEDAQKEDAIQKIKSVTGIKVESIQFIPKTEALTQMSDQLKMDFNNEENPFKDVITFNIAAKDYEDSALPVMKTQLEKSELIDHVYYEDLTISNIKRNLNKVAFFILIVSLIFVFLAIVIIRNTINLSMYADRWEIKTMELVGAKWSFIKMPYIKTGVIIGFKSFLLAVVLLSTLMGTIYFKAPDIWQIVNLFYFGLALLAILIVAVIIPAITTNAAAGKYLNKTMDELYA